MAMDSKNLTFNNSYKALYGIFIVFWIVMGALVVALWNKYAATSILTSKNQMEVVNNYLLTISPNDTSTINNATSALLDCTTSPVDKVFVSIYSKDGKLLYTNATSSRNSNVLSFSKISLNLKNDTSALISQSHTYFDTVLQKQCVITTSYSEKSKRYVISEGAVSNNTSISGFISDTSVKLSLLILLSITASTCTYMLYKHINNITRLRKYIMQLSEENDISNMQNSEISRHSTVKGITEDLYTLYKTKIDIIKQHDLERDAAIQEEKRKLSSKRTLANNLNHEIKTPIGIIIGYLDTLINHPEIDSKTQKEFLKKCMLNTQRLQNMVVNIAVISRLEDGSNTIALEDVNIWNIANQAKDDLKFTLSENNIIFKNEIKPDTFVRANEMLLYNVFCNLIKNSCLYSGGSDIVLKSLAKDEKYSTFSFYDNGKGVPGEAIPKLFNRFYRLEKDKNSKSGTGLGLPIVKESITLCCGDISVANRLEGGLEFIFSIPNA